MDPILERYQALEDKIKNTTRRWTPSACSARSPTPTTPTPDSCARRLPISPTPWQWRIVAEPELDTDSSSPAPRLHRGHRATHEEIAKLFGATVPIWWRGHQADPVQYTSKEEEQMENLRKMLMAMAKDIRVIRQNLRPAAQHAHHGVPERARK